MKDKNDEFNILANKDHPTKNLLNSYILNNYNIANELTKINSSNNINTSGTHPIIIFKKISKNNSTNTKNTNNPLPTNMVKKNNYLCDGGLKKKLDKFKLCLPNTTSPTNSTSPTFLKNLKHNSKNINGYKTMRYTSKKFLIRKKQHTSKSKEVKHNVKSIEKYHVIHPKSKEKHKKKYNSKSVEKKNSPDENKKLEELNTSKEKDDQKNKYIEILVQNGISNIMKEFKLAKKLTPKEIINKKKRDYLNLNKKTNINDKLHIIHSKKNKIKSNENTEKCNVSKSASRCVSFINNNNNLNGNENINNNENNRNILINNYFNKVEKSSSPPNSKNRKKIFKPQINQFEYLNRIHQEQKKLANKRQKYHSKNFLDYDDKDILKLQDSFRRNNSHNHTQYNINYKSGDSHILNGKTNTKVLSSGEISRTTNRKSPNFTQIKKENRQKLIEEMKDDEFPFSHRKSYRSPEEISKYLRDKRIENKKEEENTELERQKKILNTFQNLCSVDKQISNTIKIPFQLINNNKKNRKENVKTHIKIRKELNEYYCGTESSRNSSTFIDKKEFYLNILESQQFVANSRISRIEVDMDSDVEKDNGAKKNDIKINKINNGNNKNNDIEINNNDNNVNKVNNRRLNRGFSTGLLEEASYNTIQKAKIIFSKENLNKLKENLTHKNFKQIFANISSNKNHKENKENKDNKIIKNKKNQNDPNIFRKFLDKIKIIINKNTFLNLRNLYLYECIKIRYSRAFLVMITLCKRYQFKKIYDDYLHSKAKKKTQLQNKEKLLFNYNNEYNKEETKLENFTIKIQNFIFLISRVFNYGTFLKIYLFSDLNYKRKSISFLIKAIKKPYIMKSVEKIMQLINSKNIFYLKTSFKINKMLSDIVSDKLIQERYPSNINMKNSNHNINNNQNLISEILNDDSSQTQKLILNESSFIQSPNKNIPNNSIVFSEQELVKFNKIKNTEIFADKFTEYLIEKIVNYEIINKNILLPIKITHFENNSLNNSLRSNRNNSQNILDQFDQNNNSNNSLLRSLFNQSSNGSEFSKTVQELKKDEEIIFFAKYLSPILIKIICNEIKIKYERIYNNISTPLKSEFEDLIIALELKNNDQLRKNYRILYAEEELKDIINKNRIISVFLSEAAKIRKKFNIFQKNINFDIYLSECIVDTSIELINNERLYGEIGEPFPFSFRNLELVFKYDKNNSEKLIKYIYNSLNEFLTKPIFLIKDGMNNFDEKRLITYFKKDLEDNECQWEDLEIVETQSKLEVTEIIMNQLYNEVIEILEHVQLNRVRPELYQYKSIYGCEDIPKLSFQQTTENDLMPKDDDYLRDEDDDFMSV